MLKNLRSDLRKIKDPKRAKILARFFKTGKGEYGEGDVFLGITVPDSRKIAIKYKNLPLKEVKTLLQSEVHEERLIALLILVHNFQKGTEVERKAIFNLYLTYAGINITGYNLTQKNAIAEIGVKFEAKEYGRCYINNWDLVDLSADKIVGAYLLDKPRDILYDLARSENIWTRRIAIIATYQFIKAKKEYKDTFAIAKLLINDKHDLIQKAVGWMLREVGKRISQKIEEEFLKKHYKSMPRTMLRYATERFPINRRNTYLKDKV